MKQHLPSVIAEKALKDVGQGAIKYYNSAARKAGSFACSTVEHAATILTKTRDIMTKAEHRALRAMVNFIVEYKTSFNASKSRVLASAMKRTYNRARYDSIYPLERVINRTCSSDPREQSAIMVRNDTLFLMQVQFNLRHNELSTTRVRIPLANEAIKIRYIPKQVKRCGNNTPIYNQTTQNAVQLRPVIEYLKEWKSKCPTEMTETVGQETYWYIATTITIPVKVLSPNTLKINTKERLTKADISIQKYKPHSMKAAIVSFKRRNGMDIDSQCASCKHISRQTLNKYYSMPNDIDYPIEQINPLQQMDPALLRDQQGHDTV